MKIKTTTTHTLTFSVRYFAPTEGGMDSDGFGEPCGDIGAAITLLAAAKATYPRNDWVIVIDVHTDVSSNSV